MAAYRRISIDELVQAINDARDKKTSLGDVMALAQTMARSLDEAVHRHDRALHSEFVAMASQIGAMRQEIVALHPGHMRFERLPEAGHELEAVVEATENATNVIMAAAEEIMGADISDPEAYKALVDERMIAIFEACSFQDITGQRVSKVVSTLNWIEERVTSLVDKLNVEAEEVPSVEETAEEKRARELILNGPQRDGKGVSQTDIDAMLSDQASIDALFD